MRNFATLILLFAASTQAALATPNGSPPVSASPAPARYTTEDTSLGDLLDNPASNAVLKKHLPEIVGNDQVAMARSMTLRQIQSYAPDQISNEVLAKIDGDLRTVEKTSGE